jgi:hypothetical protein
VDRNPHVKSIIEDKCSRCHCEGQSAAARRIRQGQCF